MCEPTTIALVSLAIGYVNDKKQESNIHNAAVQQQDADNAALNEQAQQINQQAGDKVSERARAALIERGRLRAIVGESGLSGVSQDKSIAESYFNEGTDITSIESNRIASQKQISRERNSASARYTSTLARAPNAEANAAGAGLQYGFSYYSKTSEASRKAKTDIAT